VKAFGGHRLAADYKTAAAIQGAYGMTPNAQLSRAFLTSAWQMPAPRH
jgi:hypothetical protein